MSAPAPQAVRECGSCTLCCKLMRVKELEKPPGSWCAHCRPGRGCGIYEARPQECRVFLCDWLTHAELGPEWRPDKSKMILMRAAGARIVVKCDPGFPQAWRKEPYRTLLMRWSAQAGPRGGEVIVTVGHEMTVLANGHELRVGAVGEQDAFSIDYDTTGRPIRCNVGRPTAAAVTAPHARP